MNKTSIWSAWISRPLVITALIGLLILQITLGFTSPAMAVIRQLEEIPGQLLFQSRNTLRDQNGNAWQVVFFQRIKPDQSRQINLRLVDFPGTATFSHPQPLTVINKEQQWLAPDVFDEKAPAPNVGQYDLSEIIPEIPAGLALQLSLNLNEKQQLELRVPGAVVLEWQDVANLK